VSGIGESVLVAKSMQEGKIQGTANLRNPIHSDLNLIPDGQTLSKPIDKAIKLSFGHGINVAGVAFKKYTS